MDKNLYDALKTESEKLFNWEFADPMEETNDYLREVIRNQEKHLKSMQNEIDSLERHIEESEKKQDGFNQKNLFWVRFAAAVAVLSLIVTIALQFFH